MEDARYGGLTQKEVKERINAGKTNQSDASTGLTVKQYFDVFQLDLPGDHGAFVHRRIVSQSDLFADYFVEHHHRNHSGMARKKNA